MTKPHEHENDGSGWEIPAGLEHLRPTFIAEMEKDKDRLAFLINSGDFNELSIHAHAMRGKCAMFGERVLAAILERIGRAECADKHHLLKQVIERVRQLKI